MSTDIDPLQASQHKKHKKHKHKDKDRPEKNSAKKRRHDELDFVKTDGEHNSSPSNKRRKHLGFTAVGTSNDITQLESHSRDTLTKLAGPTDSPFAIQSISLYLPVPPVSLGDPVRGICAEHLSPLLLTYYPPVSGVVLAYTDVSLSESPLPSESCSEPILATATDEFAAPFVWASANFLVFRPRKGTELPGYINLQTESHIGLVCFNLFTVSIPRDRLPASWSWVWDEQEESTGFSGRDQNHGSSSSNSHGGGRYETEGQGHWVDENNERVPDNITFRILDFETSPWSESEKTFTSIRGSLLDEEGDRIVDKERRQLREKRKAAKDAARMRGGTPGLNGSVGEVRVPISGSRARSQSENR